MRMKWEPRRVSPAEEESARGHSPARNPQGCEAGAGWGRAGMLPDGLHSYEADSFKKPAEARVEAAEVPAVY